MRGVVRGIFVRGAVMRGVVRGAFVRGAFVRGVVRGTFVREIFVREAFCVNLFVGTVETFCTNLLIFSIVKFEFVDRWRRDSFLQSLSFGSYFSICNTCFLTFCFARHLTNQATPVMLTFRSSHK